MGEVAELLRELAAVLGVTVEHLWAVLIWQAQIGAIYSAAKAIMVLVAMVAYFKVAAPWLRILDADGTESDLEFNRIAVGVIGSFVVVAGVAIFCSLTFRAAAALLNPEYLALQEILQVLR